MAERICSIDGCERRAVYRLWCRLHYRRWRVHGDVLWHPPTVLDRLEANIDRDGICWLWTGYIDPMGYGRLSVSNVPRLAHIVSYEHYVGPVPDGLELDHDCRIRHCVRPSHLAPVTHRANILLSAVLTAYCPAGHRYDDATTYYRSTGQRVCRECARVHDRRRYRMRQST